MSHWQLKSPGEFQHGWDELLKYLKIIVGADEMESWGITDPLMREWLIVEWFEQHSSESKDMSHAEYYQHHPEKLLAWVRKNPKKIAIQSGS